MTAMTCGTVSAVTLGLPPSVAVAQERGALPKAAFVGKAPVSAKLKQRLVNDIASIAFLALMRDTNTGVQPGIRVPEILVMGLRLASGNVEVPTAVIDHIAAQRRSAMLFVCVRDKEDGETGAVRQEYALAVRRALPGRAGHIPTYMVYVGSWRSAEEAALRVLGDTLDEVWDALTAQAILGQDHVSDIDAAIARRARMAQLEADIDKLTRDHARAKQPQQRNEVFAKLHKAKAELEALSKLSQS